MIHRLRCSSAILSIWCTIDLSHAQRLVKVLLTMGKGPDWQVLHTCCNLSSLQLGFLPGLSFNILCVFASTSSSCFLALSDALLLRSSTESR
jgi:hypothetical protein